MSSVTVEIFWSDMTEYKNEYLLFVYEDESGRPWGQWDTQEKFLPDYKTHADKVSPAPPEQEFQAWLGEYKGRIVIPETFRNLPKISKGFAAGKGNGVGVGVGDGKGKAAAVQQPAAQQPPSNTKAVTVRALAGSVATDLAKVHAEFKTGSLKDAREAIEELLHSAENPESVATDLRFSHGAFLPEFHRRRQKRQFIPNLAKWVRDGDWKNPPGGWPRLAPAAIEYTPDCLKCGDRGAIGGSWSCIAELRAEVSAGTACLCDCERGEQNAEWIANPS